MENVQDEFDALVAKHGAKAVIEAIKAHTVSQLGSESCSITGCPEHYVCNIKSGNCQLDIGG